MHKEFHSHRRPEPLSPTTMGLAVKTIFTTCPWLGQALKMVPFINAPPSSSYLSSPFLPTIFSVISHHGIQNFGSLLKY